MVQSSGVNLSRCLIGERKESLFKVDQSKLVLFKLKFFPPFNSHCRNELPVNGS